MRRPRRVELPAALVGSGEAAAESASWSMLLAVLAFVLVLTVMFGAVTEVTVVGVA